MFFRLKKSEQTFRLARIFGAGNRTRLALQSALLGDRKPAGFQYPPAHFTPKKQSPDCFLNGANLLCEQLAEYTKRVVLIINPITPRGVFGFM